MCPVRRSARRSTAQRSRSGRGPPGRRHNGAGLPSARRTGPAPHLLIRAGELDISVLRSILETRLHNGPKVAELAAERRPAELAGLLDGAVRALEAQDDPIEQQRHALTFWDHIVDGADSIAFRLMYNTLRATGEPALPALATMMADEVGRPDAYRKLADAIAAGDPLQARHAAQDLLDLRPQHSSPHSTAWRIDDDHHGGADNPKGIHALGGLARILETPSPRG